VYARRIFSRVYVCLYLSGQLLKAYDRCLYKYIFFVLLLLLFKFRSYDHFACWKFCWILIRDVCDPNKRFWAAAKNRRAAFVGDCMYDADFFLFCLRAEKGGFYLSFEANWSIWNHHLNIWCLLLTEIRRKIFALDFFDKGGSLFLFPSGKYNFRLFS
jgi:hypothetical protein